MKRYLSSQMRSNCSAYLFYACVFVTGYTLYLRHFHPSIRSRAAAPENVVTFTECSSRPLEQEKVRSYQPSFQRVGDTETHVYSAYYDQRQSVSRTVRVLSLTDPEPRQMYCLMWYPDGRRVSVAARAVDLLQRLCWIMAAYKHFAYLFYCPERTGGSPTMVSLTEVPCEEPTNHVLVQAIARAPRKNVQLANKVGVCHKTLHHITSAHAVVEWLEMQKLMGAAHVTFYGVYNVTPDVEQVIDYYRQKHFVSVVPWPLPWPSTRYWTQGSVELYEFAQQLMVNDCTYRYMDRFKWLAFLDMDEYIVPRDPEVFTYQDMLAQAEEAANTKEKIASFKFANSHYCLSSTHVFTGLASFITMETVKRNQIIWGLGKSMVQPRRVVVMDVHYVLQAVPYTKGNVTVPIKYGLMQHYRKLNYAPIEKVPTRPCFIPDDSMQKYGRDLIFNANAVLRAVNLHFTKAEEHFRRFGAARNKVGIKTKAVYLREKKASKQQKKPGKKKKN